MKPSQMNLRELRAEFRAVSAERDQIHQSLVNYKVDITNLQNTLKSLEDRCLWAARNLVQERQDLQARINKINLRLVALGFADAAGFVEKK